MAKSKQPQKPKATALERAFMTRWLQIAPREAPEPVFQCRFDASKRAFDFGWPDQKIAVEMQGGIWTRGAHGRGSGIVKDYIKNNDAVALGWRFIYISTDMLENDPIKCVGWVLTALGFPAGCSIESTDPGSP